MVIFAEKYRNGFYKGSGLYTLGITQVSAFLVVFLTVKLKVLNKYYFFMLIIVFVTSSLLGLRIFLMPIYLFLLIRVLSGKISVSSIVSVTLLILLFIGFKLVLAEDLSQSALLDIFMHILGRNDYSSLVHDDAYSLEAKVALGFLPFYGVDVGQFKEIFAGHIPDLIYNKPNIGLFTGIALPITIILFNSFSWTAINFVIFIIVLFLLSLQKSIQTDNMASAVINIFITYFCFSILTEDILMFYKMPLIIFTIYFTIVVLKFCKPKNI
ncbi:hypothetical protein P4S65_06980 [Pseudoalteromonas sp. B131b]|uniref:hypothetical protein n=1 Tax=Pseudoalteromonas sp. B131b TaxID=630493 RepID=UPI00301E2738